MTRLDQKYRYYAFISYNHRDEREAKWLQRQLEHYRLPSVARKEIGEDVKIQPVFRYAVNLSLGDLRRQVKEELDASRFLIVICSPNSARPNIEGKHWVNDEAMRFIETGRVDDIIPVIVDGEPNAGGDRECFPPALRNKEISGANLSKGSRSERRRDFLKIVAKLLGILPDQLIRHTEEEEKHARFRFWLKLLPLAILAAVGGLFAWDSTRTVQNYYADYVDSYGLPEGIFPLKKVEIVHRYVHYRFEYRGFQFGASPHADSSDWCIWKLFGLRRRLVRVVQANSHGLPREHEHPGYEDRPQIQDFAYDNDLRLSEIRYGRYNGENQEPCLEERIELSDEGGAVNGLLQFFSSEGRLGKVYAKTSRIKSRGTHLPSKTEIAQHIVRRDSRGRVEMLLFLNSSGANVVDGDGLHGFRYEYDELGRKTAKWYVFRDGDEFRRRPNKKGIAGIRYEYFRHNVKKIENVDPSGSPLTGPHGWMVLECAYDSNDNIIEELTYDANGNRVRRKEGYAKLCREYDAHGNMTCERYFDVDGKPTLNTDGYAELRMEYDAEGKMTRSRYFGVDGNPTLHTDGYAEICYEYDARGNVVRVRYFGVDGSPTLIKNGYAELCREYDARGKLTRWRCFGVDGKPTLHNDGVAEFRREYDTRGNITRELRFGVDGKPVLDRSGTAGWKIEYDVRGNWTRVRFIGVDGNPISLTNGCAEVRREYDARGHVTKARYFGVDGKPALLVAGHAGFVAEYDKSGRETRRIFLGVDGNPTLTKDGYAECRKEYDAHGNVTKRGYYGVDGRPVSCKEGFAEVRIVYDDKGDEKEVSHYDEKGKPVVLKEKPNGEGAEP